MTDKTQIQPPEPTNPGNPLQSVLVLNKDLFFGVTIANTLRALGYRPKTIRSAQTLSAEIAKLPDAALIVIDITAVDDWTVLETALLEVPDIPSIAFGSHTNVDGLRSAKRIGIGRVFSNGEFHRTMGATITRYARTSPPDTAPPA